VWSSRAWAAPACPATAAIISGVSPLRLHSLIRPARSQCITRHVDSARPHAQVTQQPFYTWRAGMSQCDGEPPLCWWRRYSKARYIRRRWQSSRCLATWPDTHRQEYCQPYTPGSARSSRPATATCPPMHAKCRGVFPVSVAQRGTARASSSKYRTHSSWPLALAATRALTPLSMERFGRAPSRSSTCKGVV
jgi:hypothetical protein